MTGREPDHGPEPASDASALAADPDASAPDPHERAAYYRRKYAVERASRKPVPVDPVDPDRLPGGMRRCTATSTVHGGRCGQPALSGAEVCSTHGGSIGRVQAKAARNVELAAGRAEWERVSLGGPLPDGDPAGVVLGEISWCHGHVVWLRERVQQIAPEALVWGVASRTRKGTGQWPGVDTTRAAAPNVWLVVYGQERDRLLRMCEAAHRMGIAQRQVELAERLGSQVATVLDRVLSSLNLTAEQWSTASTAVPAALRLISGGEADE